MITPDEYFKDSREHYGYVPTAFDLERADDLLTRVNGLFEALGIPCELRSGHRTRAKTLALIGSNHRAVVGGNHEQSLAVDVADNENEADDAIDDELLEAYGLYREDPEHTHTWAHLQSVPPHSGRRTFIP